MRSLKFLLCIGLFFIAACSSSYKKKNRVIEPSINSALDEISRYTPARPYISFFKNRPARIDFKDDKYICSSYDFKNGIILLPRQLDNSPEALKLEILKGLYLWKVHNDYKLEALMVEEAELAEIKAIEYFFELGVKNDTLSRDFGLNTVIGKGLCTLITMNSKIFLNYTNNKYISNVSACGWPLETLNKQKIWFSRLKESIEDGSFIQLMYESDMDKVKRGLMSESDASRNAAILRSKPLYEIYRQERGYSDISLERLKKFQKEYAREKENFFLWEKTHASDIENARYEYTICAGSN